MQQPWYCEQCENINDDVAVNGNTWECTFCGGKFKWNSILHPTPWTFHRGSPNEIKDANGVVVMTDEPYYPSIDLAPIEWQWLVDAMNRED